MADEKEQKHGAAAGASASGGTGEGASQSGDPGRTPTKAEGDEETVDESLNEKGNG